MKIENSALNTARAVANNGVDQINDTAGHTGRWKTFVVNSAIVITTITEEEYDDVNGASTILTTPKSIPAGSYASANGVFTYIKLASGFATMNRD